MTRQENITLTQVEHKVYEAQDRMRKNLTQAAIAQTAHDFVKFMQEARKAESDLGHWRTVQSALS